MIKRIYTERKSSNTALENDLFENLGIRVAARVFIRYDVDTDDDKFAAAVPIVFSTPATDEVYYEQLPQVEGEVFGIEYLPGQFDQRADSAAQCVQLLTQGERPTVRCATVYAVKASEKEIALIKNYLVNPVESRLCSLEKPTSLEQKVAEPEPARLVDGFTQKPYVALYAFYKEQGFAMSIEDLQFVQSYFRGERREPTYTELKVIDTYWSDHCRHTTFLTALKTKIKSDNPHIAETYAAYTDMFNVTYQGRADKYPSLMDVATIGAKVLRKQGYVSAQDVSPEINACTIKYDLVMRDGTSEPWYILYKNETHNHPTEIEPFGGAATCLGGAIRDPLSGRAFVYQAMRVTGAADINAPFEDTIEGKLPQRVISKRAAKGYSSYGNQIGLATGEVKEYYHEGYVAKRLETGFVVGAAKAENVVREEPRAGDLVLLLGGETGRDGCGGATGSSKPHDAHSIETCGAEVQKGNAPIERMLQRLMRNGEFTKLVKRCNDFGAGGVAVAIGELSDGLEIQLDKVPKKYEGLSGTELAISESQERMAVVVESKNVEEFIKLAAEENLSATAVAVVTDDRRMKMFHRGRAIVDISRDFLDTNGVKQITDAEINDNVTDFFAEKHVKDFNTQLSNTLSEFNVCSKKGLAETFDSTIGAKSVYMPFGGKNQLTPVIAMAAKLTGGETDDCTVSAYGYNPELMSTSPFTGAIYSIVTSVAKVVAAGGKGEDIRLSLQEFFMRLRDDKKRWGVPLAALLGALYAQINLGLGAIGGKDSMSGTFEDIDVPPTLISFALAPAKASELITNVIEREGQKLYLLPMRKDKNFIPDFEYLKKLYAFVNNNIKSGKIAFATVVEKGGVAAAVAKSCFGNGFGFNFGCAKDLLFREGYGDIIVSVDDESIFGEIDGVYLGKSIVGDFICGNEQAGYSSALNAYTGKLDGVFPTTAPAEGDIPDCDYTVKSAKASSLKTAKPRVFIPAFPGTNCELDTARAFKLAGAEPEILVVKNRTPADIEESVKAIIKAIDRANIIAFPGGFSGGDEPDGSGKFIATTFMNPAISEKVMNLLQGRDGLILGICNGFQALIKLGLVPYGEVRPLTENSPTLTYNNISRHVSTMVNIRVASDISPWLSACKVGEVYAVPVSHGEGKVVAPVSELEAMRLNGQIATQYVDLSGKPTMESPYNPNGSTYAIEGITSPDGRVFGKMGHSERTGVNLYKNYCGNFDMKIFESGVKYFK